MDEFRRLLRTIHGHAVWQVAVSYLLGVWAAVQLTDTIAAILGLSDGFLRLVLMLLLAGLPVALAATWMSGQRPAALAEATARRLRTGGSRWRPIALAGTVGLMLTTLVTAGWIGSRALGIGPARTLAQDGRLASAAVVLADFAATAQDRDMAVAATAALRIDLEQSHALTVLDEATVREARTRMMLPDSAPLDETAALELAQREGAAAVIAGEVHSLGDARVLTLRLRRASDRHALVSLRETAERDRDVVAAIGRLSRQLRERAGETLRSMSASEPLERLTTRSVEALRLYAAAARALTVEGDLERAIALSEDAVARDSLFALAWVHLGIARINEGRDPEAVRTALTRAWELRDRLSGPERLLVEATYYDDVSNDTDRAIASYRALYEEYPLFKPLMVANNLALLYEVRREYERAALFFRRALERDSSSFVPFLNLASAQTALGQADSAAATVAAMRARHAGNPWNHVVSFYLASAHGDLEAARREMELLREAQAGDAFWRAQTAAGLGSIARVQGRLAEVERHARDIAALRSAEGDSAGVLAMEIVIAGLDAWERGAPERALASRVGRLEPGPGLPHLDLARLHADAGDAAGARAFLDAWERDTPADARRADEQQSGIIRAWVLLVEGDAAAAVEEARRGEPGACRLCALPVLATAFEAAGQPDSAIAAWARYLETPGLFRIDEVDTRWLARAHEAVAALHEQRGDRQRARSHYARFAEIRAAADPPLAARAAAAREKVAALAGDR